jgi:hypothetical protein
VHLKFVVAFVRIAESRRCDFAARQFPLAAVAFSPSNAEQAAEAPRRSKHISND